MKVVDPKQAVLRTLGAVGGCPVCGVLDGTVEPRTCVRWIRKSTARRVRRAIHTPDLKEMFRAVVVTCCLGCAHLAYQKLRVTLSIKTRGERLLGAGVE